MEYSHLCNLGKCSIIELCIPSSLLKLISFTMYILEIDLFYLQVSSQRKKAACYGLNESSEIFSAFLLGVG